MPIAQWRIQQASDRFFEENEQLIQEAQKEQVQLINQRRAAKNRKKKKMCSLKKLKANERRAIQQHKEHCYEYASMFR